MSGGVLKRGRRCAQFRRDTSAKLEEDLLVAVHLQSPMFDRMAMRTTMDPADLVFVT